MTYAEIAKFQSLFSRFIDEKLSDSEFMRKIAIAIMMAFLVWLDE